MLFIKDLHLESISMKIKIHLLFKYFFTNNKGNFRKTFLFQIIGLFFGSLIIALTYGIMDGMEYEISRKINIYNYKYCVHEKDIIDSFDYLNSGKESLAQLQIENQASRIVNIQTFNHFQEFYSKINYSSKLINPTDNKILDKDAIIIGESLANEYNLKLGDKIILSDIINLNPITGTYISQSYYISYIYSFSFINYDYNNVFILENGNFFKNNSLNYFYDNNFHKNKVNSIQSNKEFSTLLSAISLEKYIYASLGGFILLIASIMIFNNAIIMLLEKRKQYKLLYAQGISEKNILQITLFITILISFISSSLGYSFSFIIYFLNEKYNLLKYLFIYSPFEEIPIIISFDKYILNIALVIVLTSLATMFAIVKVRNDIEEL